MNKISLIKNNKTEESNVNQVKKKSKFKKFLSSSMAVMVLTVGLSSPMTLRADDSQERVKKRIDKTIELIDEKIEEKNKRIERNNEIIEKADKEIERNKKILEEAKKEEMEAKKQEMEAKKQEMEAKKQEMEAKKQEMEARNKLKEKCKSMGNNIQLAEKYCTKNKCTEEQNKILEKSKSTYNKECVRFVAKSE